MLNFLQVSFLFSLIGVVGCQDEPHSTIPVSGDHVVDLVCHYETTFCLAAELNTSSHYWDITQKRLLFDWHHGENQHINRVHLADKADKALTIATDTVSIWDTRQGHNLGFWQFPARITASSITKDGQYAAFAFANQEVLVVDLHKKIPLQRLTLKSIPRHIDLTAQAKHVLISDENKTIWLFDVIQNKLIASWKFEQRINYLKISPSQKYALYSLTYGPLGLLDLQTGTKKFTLQPYPWLQILTRPLLNTTAAAFNQDETLLVTASPSGKMYVWDLTTQTLQHRWTLPKPTSQTRPTSAIIYHVGFNKAETQIITGNSDGIMQIWPLPQQNDR